MALPESPDWVEQVVTMAVRMGASDIHIEPCRGRYQVRFRQDGDLRQVTGVPPCTASAVQRLKVLADMDIAERRLPQDGSFQMETPVGQMDIRVATLPTVEGEKLVLRLLRHAALLDDLAKLGMEGGMLAALHAMLNRLRGMIIATGPTGSGKSTTLLAALRFLRAQPLNIVTLEDPVESRIDGISQVQINERAGLTFAKGLRSILRQDPDVIMIGEIRDRETAEIAVRAALTGHLVLTTLHTDTAEGALIRLVDLGVESYLVGAAVKGVLNQRLVKCLTGGRRAIFQLLPVTAEVQQWLQNGADPTESPNVLLDNPLEASLRKLVLQGVVAAGEYARLFGGDLPWPDSAGDGQAIASSPDFADGWPDSWGAASHSARA